MAVVGVRAAAVAQAGQVKGTTKSVAVATEGHLVLVVLAVELTLAAAALAALAAWVVMVDCLVQLVQPGQPETLELQAATATTLTVQVALAALVVQVVAQPVSTSAVCLMSLLRKTVLCREAQHNGI